MNSPINKPIVDFIVDFNLLKENDPLIHFPAKIVYISGSKTYRYECEVAIVTIKIKELDAIYLLSSSIKEDGLDEMFVIKKEKITYQKDGYLLIKREGGLKVYIIPSSTAAIANKTIRELHMDGIFKK